MRLSKYDVGGWQETIKVLTNADLINFLQNIGGCDYYIIHLLYGNYMSLLCSMLSTCIKATVHSIRYFNSQKIELLFVWSIGNLHKYGTPSPTKLSFIWDFLSLLGIYPAKNNRG